MTPQLAQMALQFLARADLKGVEVDPFIAVCQALQELVNTPPASATPKEG